MNHFWRLLTLLFVVSIPTYYVPIILDDLAHPERWDYEIFHDPRIYFPMLAVVVVMGLLMAVHIYWTERRKR